MRRRSRKMLFPKWRSSDPWYSLQSVYRSRWCLLLLRSRLHLFIEQGVHVESRYEYGGCYPSWLNLSRELYGQILELDRVSFVLHWCVTRKFSERWDSSFLTSVLFLFARGVSRVIGFWSASKLISSCISFSPLPSPSSRSYRPNIFYISITHSSPGQIAKPYLSINNQAVSSCGDHSWCCQSETADAPYCCTGKDKFTTDPVNENLVVIPAFPSSPNSSTTAIAKPSSSSRTTIISSSQTSSGGRNKSQTIALGVGLGIPLAVALAAGLVFVMRSRARGRLYSGDLGKVEEIDSSAASSRVVEASGQKEYELPVERDTPVELYVKPVWPFFQVGNLFSSLGVYGGQEGASFLLWFILFQRRFRAWAMYILDTPLIFSFSQVYKGMQWAVDVDAYWKMVIVGVCYLWLVAEPS